MPANPKAVDFLPEIQSVKHDCSLESVVGSFDNTSRRIYTAASSFLFPFIIKQICKQTAIPKIQNGDYRQWT